MDTTSSIIFKPTIRDLRGRFAKANKRLVENRRKATRVLARRWVKIAREEAPLGSGRNKKRAHGTFRRSIGFTEFTQKGEVGFSSQSEQPLGTFITHGTRPHKIYAKRRNGALYFFWGKIGKFVVVPRRGGFKNHVSDGKLWIGKGFVKHPGTKPNPYIERAYKRWYKEMDKEILAVADKFVIDFVGNV